MSLTTCLKKAGDALNAEDRAAILAAAAANRASGMKPAEAAAKAVQDRLGVHHLGVQAGMACEQSVEVAAVAVRPVHHRRYGHAPGAGARRGGRRLHQRSSRKG